MNLPKTIIILGAKFDVVVDKLEKDCGTTQTSLRRITIHSELDDDVKGETFFHEVTHGILGLSGISALLDDAHEEAICQSLGYGLWRLIRENPDKINLIP